MATKTATRPSQLVQIENDPWLAYQFDNAVILIGSAIENASQETTKIGNDEHSELRLKYTMTQLLDPDFRLPTKQHERPIEADIKGVSGAVFDEVS